MNKTREIPEEEMALMKAVDDAIIRAGDKMELADLSDDMDDDEKDSHFDICFVAHRCTQQLVAEDAFEQQHNLDFVEVDAVERKSIGP